MTQRHPLREPMVWLLVGLPVVAVVAGIATVVISSRGGGADAVIDPGERTAQIQTVELGPDERAAALKLSAVLQVDGQRLRLLPASGDWVVDTTSGDDDDDEAQDTARPSASQRLRDATSHQQTLELVLSHPSRAEDDLHLQLAPSDLGWETELSAPLDPGHDWLARLTPAGGHWRLRGRLVAGQHAARLGPALAED